MAFFASLSILVFVMKLKGFRNDNLKMTHRDH